MSSFCWTPVDADVHPDNGVAAFEQLREFRNPLSLNTRIADKQDIPRLTTCRVPR